MGKMVSMVGGAVAILIGVILCFVSREALWLGIQFSAIVILLFGGFIALIAGISEMKDAAAAKKEEEKKE